MDQYVGLDVSLKETSISVRQNRKRIWRGKCLSHPKAVAEAIRKHAPDAVLVVFETGPLATWFHRKLTADDLPAVCIDARHAKAALDTAPNKTDANDADGLALLAETGFFREVRVKSWEAMRVRALIGGRAQLVGISTELSNHIRGVMKTFGLIVPKGGGRIFETNVKTLLAGQEALAAIALPLLETWRAVRMQAARLDRQLMVVARASATCRLTMTAPGIGALTALSYTSMIEDPVNFKNSRAVGAYVGLAARGYQSGEIDYDGHISKRGDKRVRSLLYEAAILVLTRVRSESALRSWGRKLKERVGFKRAVVAVARKLAVILHAMWRDGSAFDPKTTPA
ncbi:MAG: IS110 family transposase [Nitrospiraceae bacterium]